ncbi:MAG: hypothetical protein E7603_00945 [Ruminococcaceae bacterium]|nr:hypothetical protein [Oscillospiraceae bacterium]
MYKKILDKMPENVKSIHKFIIWFCAILFVAGVITMLCDMVYFDVVFFIGIGIIGFALMLFIDCLIAVYFYQFA